MFLGEYKLDWTYFEVKKIAIPENFETGPEGPELEGHHIEIKRKSAQSISTKQIRRTCPSGHGSGVSGPKLHAVLIRNCGVSNSPF